MMAMRSRPPRAAAADVVPTGGSRLRPRSLTLADGGMGSSGTGRLRARVAEIVELVKSKALRPLPAYLRVTEFISDPNSVSELLRAYAKVVGSVGVAENEAFGTVAARYCTPAVGSAGVQAAIKEVDNIKIIVEKGFDKVMRQLGIVATEIPLLAILNALWIDDGADEDVVVQTILDLDC